MPRERLSIRGPARRLLFGATAAGFGAGALLAGQSVLLSLIIDRVFRRGWDPARIAPLLGWVIGLLLLRALCLWLQEIWAQRAAGQVKSALRTQLTDHLYALGPAYTRTQRSGDLVNAAVEGVEALDAYLTQFLPARYLAGLLPLFILLLVFLLDPWTSLILLFTGPMLILLLALIGGRAEALTRQRFAELSWMSAFFLDLLRGLPTLKLFGRSREQAETIEEISRAYGKSTLEVLATAFQSSLVMEWAATAATAMVALETSLRLMNGVLPFERALALLLLTPEFFLPLRQFAVKYHMGAAGKAALERINQVLETPAPAAPAGTHSAAPRFDSRPDPQQLPMRIRFEGVTLRYPPGADGGEERPPALRCLSFTAEAGQSVALVGASGAGKSTVINALAGFVLPQSGQLSVGGVPLARLEMEAWRRQIAWMPQQPHLFHGTVADNIRLARPDAAPEELVSAAQSAHAHEFITQLPQGYETRLGEGGAGLSGGQRQRLALARVFLKDAPLVLLDEITANLDEESEALVRGTLETLLRAGRTGDGRPRTVLLAAHRLELARAADRIVVMDRGRAVQSGPHGQLASVDGPYRALLRAYTGDCADQDAPDEVRPSADLVTGGVP
ncbi:MAG: thiol reductant ABC exporter subunit CydD [Caldilineaceae bacterium]|nr:thiol reductant ABC exporter subunit CydD [Caldilineaceae bacterium]